MTRKEFFSWLIVFAVALAIVFCFFGLTAIAHGQAVDSAFYVKQFSTQGNTVGALVTAAMKSCPAAPVPCILVVDPSLAAWATGTMPTLCGNCYLDDWRTGPPSPLPPAGGSYVPVLSSGTSASLPALFQSRIGSTVVGSNIYSDTSGNLILAPYSNLTVTTNALFTGNANSTGGYQIGAVNAFLQGNTNTGTGSHNAFTTCGSGAAAADSNGWANFDCGYGAGGVRSYGDQNVNIGALAGRYASGITGTSFTAQLTGTSLTGIVINSGGSGGVHNACYELEINGSETANGSALGCTNSAGVVNQIYITAAGNFGSTPTVTMSPSGSQNVNVGYGAGGALNALSTDYGSIYLGYEAGAFIGSSLSGECASYGNVGVGQFAFGAQSGPSCVTRGTAIGNAAAKFVLTGGSFFAGGRSALQNATNIVQSVAVGHASAYDETSSTDDVLIGDEVAVSSSLSGGDNLVTGVSNTFVGEQSGITTGSSGVSNYRGAFGWGALVSCDYCIGIGPSSTVSAGLGHSFKVGILNSNPQYSLDVGGTINASGPVTFGAGNAPVGGTICRINAPAANTGSTSNTAITAAECNIPSGTVDATGTLDIELWLSACTGSGVPYASCTVANTGTCTTRIYLATTAGGSTTGIAGAIATPATKGGRYSIKVQAQNSLTSEQVDTLAINSTAVAPIPIGLTTFNLGTTALYVNPFMQNSVSGDYCVIDQMTVTYTP